MEQHGTLIGVMQRRMSSIKVIQTYWSKGSITSALNALNMMNDTSIVMDLLNNTFAENQKIDTLNYENIAQILPHATSLVNSKYETHILAGLKTSFNIIKMWGPEMIKIKTIPVGGGVDLSREERIKKVELCIDHFMNLYKSKGF
jgi:katanin p80 WD40 repeat-containing subunit B1